MNEVKYWETKDGTKIKIEEMKTKHIIKAIKCLKSGKVKGTKTIQMHDFEQSDYQGISAYRTAKIYAQLEYMRALKNELKKRGIDYD